MRPPSDSRSELDTPSRVSGKGSGAPRKAFVTQNVLSHMLSPGSEFARAISDEPPMMIYEFSTSTGTVHVTWSEGRPVALRAPEGATVIDVVGREVEGELEVGNFPMYVRSG